MITFEQAKSYYSTVAMMKDDFPDGMFDDMKEAREAYRDDKDPEMFAEWIEEIMTDYGYPCL